MLRRGLLPLLLLVGRAAWAEGDATTSTTTATRSSTTAPTASATGMTASAAMTSTATAMTASAAMTSTATAMTASATGTVGPDLTSPVGFEVRVRGKRPPRTAGSAHVLRERELERFEHDDVQQVLHAVPGVYSRGEDGLGLRPNIAIRGTNPDRSKKITLLEDGILFAPAPYSAPAAYYFPLVTRMTEVRVLKGPASIAYGPHTVGGAIDLITRDVPDEPSAGVDLALGQYEYGKLHAWAGAGGPKLGFLVEGVHLRSDGFKELPDPGASTGFYKNEWMAKASYRHDGPGGTRGELRLKLGFANERSNETYVGLTDADFREAPLRRYGISQLDQMNFYRTSAVLSHVWTLAPKLTFTTSIYRNDLSRTWRRADGFRGASLFDVLTRPDDPRNAVYRDLAVGRGESSSADEAVLLVGNQREFVAQGVELRARWDVETGPLAHRLEVGARLHEDRVERRHTQDGYRVVGTRLEPEGSPTVVTVFNEASTVAGAFHATDVLTWGELTLSPGVRVELLRSTFVERTTGDTSIRTHAVVLPGVGAYYALLPELGALASVHRGFSPPAPALGVSNAPELSVAYEGGLRFLRNGIRAEVLGYYNDYSNLTDVCTLSSGCSDQNLDRQFDAGAARIYGFEATASHELPLDAGFVVPISVAYTLSRSELTTTFSSADPIFGQVERGDELAYIPTHQAHASLGLEHERGGVNVAATYVSRMREQAGKEPLEQVLATDEQWIIDLSGKVRLFGPVALYVNLRNLLDQAPIVARRPFGARPAAPRWLQVGLQARF